MCGVGVGGILPDAFQAQRQTRLPEYLGSAPRNLCRDIYWVLVLCKAVIFITWIIGGFLWYTEVIKVSVLALFTQQVFPEDRLSSEQNRVQDSLRVNPTYYVLPLSMSNARTAPIPVFCTLESWINSYLVLRLLPTPVRVFPGGRS